MSTAYPISRRRHTHTHSLSLSTYTYTHTGKTYEHCVPDIEAQAHTHTHTLYIYIHTHTGKTCEHRVPDDEAQAWLDALLHRKRLGSQDRGRRPGDCCREVEVKS